MVPLQMGTHLRVRGKHRVKRQGYDSRIWRDYGSRNTQLGVFICASRMTRGVPVHSACATGVLWPGRNIPGCPPFCPLFSRNRR